MDWRDKVKTAPGERLVPLKSGTAGFMAETDMAEYEIIAADGTRSGSVTVRDHTAVNGSKRTITVVQRDASGKVVGHESWKA